VTTAPAEPSDDEPEDQEAADEAAAPDGRAARAERRRNERRRAILDAAKRVFREKGYHPTSVHDVIDEARIARGTFYLYFASKQDVFGELVDEFLLVIRGAVRRILVGSEQLPPFEQLRANFRRVVAAVLEHDEVATIILRDPTGFDGDSAQSVDRFFSQVLAMVEDALRVGQGLGIIRDCDLKIVAAMALGGLQQVLNRMLAAHAGDPATRQRERTFADAEHLADELLQFLLRGLLTGPRAEPSA
jgi:AcrR family transcriptional regulator